METMILVFSLLALLASAAVLILVTQLGRRLTVPGGTGLEQALRDELRSAREEAAREARSLREEVTKAQRETGESATRSVAVLIDSIRDELMRSRQLIEQKLREIQEGNERKLEQMRQVVDEKLQTTLEKRLGESFKLVSERLEAVQRGLGEMQALATGVGDLKRVLTNVKERGTWGEYQLEAILEQILTPEQYVRKFQPRGGPEQVEFAIRLPGQGTPDSAVWLPIDAKFPKEDYERLVEASQVGDAEGVRRAKKDLLAGLDKCARDIHDKYINPPLTTDFAIMFLPTEGLYAEVLREPGYHDRLQQQYHIVLTGPTTLSAILSSLRIGFHTLAIEKRSSEVWQILGAVKAEFGKFGGILEKVRKQLSAASNTLDETVVRTRAMERRLRNVQELSGAEPGSSVCILPAGEEEDGVIPLDAPGPGESR